MLKLISQLRVLLFVSSAVLIFNFGSFSFNVIDIYSLQNDLNLFADSVNRHEVFYFDFGKYDLKAEAFPVLDGIAEKMQSNKNCTIAITGYTDNISSEGFNIRLSLKRAEAVQYYLINRGVEPERIKIYGNGKNDPLNNNSNDEERALNRRVIFSFDYTEKNKGNTAIIERVAGRQTAEGTYKNIYSTAKFELVNRNEITADISIRDTSGFPVDSLKEDDISAVLKWDNEGSMDSTEGTTRLIPINDRKKLAITLTMDYSGSMFGVENYNVKTPKSTKILEMEKSAGDFIKKLDKNMYCRIIKFGDKIVPVCSFTNNKKELHNALESLGYPLGGTALYSSVMTALSDSIFSSNPTYMKTVIAFTDGMENSSKGVTLEKIFKKCEETSTKVFTIGLFDLTGEYKPSFEEMSKGKNDLQLMAQNSGGFFYIAQSSSMLGTIYDNIFRQVLSSYNISIVWNSSKLPPKGTQVKAELKINVKGTIRTLYKNYVME